MSVAEDAHLDPWQIRNRYVRVTLGQVSAAQFLKDEGLQNGEMVERLELLLAASYFRQRMYASNTFKFEDLSRTESRYAVANGLRAAFCSVHERDIPAMVDSISRAVNDQPAAAA